MRPYVYFLMATVLAVAIVGAEEHQKKASGLGPRSSVPTHPGGGDRGPRTEDRGLLLIPVEGVTPDHLKSDFNDSRGGFRVHHAIDILAPLGTPVHAAVGGTVRKLFTSRAGGLTIYEFDRDQSRCYYYAHLDHYATGLHEGQAISQGDVIGYVGTTGNAPKNTPHLHFAVSILPPTREWWKGTPIDPYPLLVAHPITADVSGPR